jgi:hypothetical protein
LVRRQRAEYDVGLPGLGHRTDDDFAFRDLSQDAPPERLHFCKESSRTRPIVGGRSQNHLATAAATPTPAVTHFALA